MEHKEIDIIHGRLKKESIVFVDDEVDILNSIKRLFRKECYEMHFFSSGFEALEFIKNNKVSMVVTDMRMPEISGIELLKQLAEISPDSTCIIISGYEEKEIILEAIASGLAKQYIIKPWDDVELKKLIKDLMELNRNLERQRLLGVLKLFKNLPSPPKLHYRLIQHIRNGEVSKNEITSEIEKSPALVSKLLRISNSVYYSARKQILCVSDALMFLGTESVANIILALESYDAVCSRSTENVRNIISDLRSKSVMRGNLARLIANSWDYSSYAQTIYGAALLLDIGLILRLCSASEQLDVFLKIHSKTNSPYYFVDKEIFGITHDEVGAALLTYWNIPEPIIAAVRNHHSMVGDDKFLRIIQIADYIVQGEDSLPQDTMINDDISFWENSLHDEIQQIKNTNWL